MCDILFGFISSSWTSFHEDEIKPNKISHTNAYNCYAMCPGFLSFERDNHRVVAGSILTTGK